MHVGWKQLWRLGFSFVHATVAPTTASAEHGTAGIRALMSWGNAGGFNLCHPHLSIGDVTVSRCAVCCSALFVRCIDTGRDISCWVLGAGCWVVVLLGGNGGAA